MMPEVAKLAIAVRSRGACT